MSVVIALVVLTLFVVLVARYGADSRTGADPTGRDVAWTGAPYRPHGPGRDLTAARSAVRRLARAWAGQVRAHEILDARLRPWEGDPRLLAGRTHMRG